MRTILILVSFILVSGCASMGVIPDSRPSGAVGPDVLSSAWDGKTDVEVLSKQLTRKEEFWYAEAPYSIEAIYYAPSYIEAEATVRTKKHFGTEQDVRTAIESRMRSFAGNKACFLFTNQTQIIEEGYFRRWTVNLVTPDGHSTKIDFVNATGVESVPNAGSFYTKIFSFYNSTVGCTKHAVDTSKGFKLMVAAPNSKAKQAILTWEVKPTKTAGL